MAYWFFDTVVLIKLRGINGWAIVCQGTGEDWSWAPLDQCKLRLATLMLSDKLPIRFSLTPFLQLCAQSSQLSLASNTSQQPTSVASLLEHGLDSCLTEHTGTQSDRLQS